MKGVCSGGGGVPRGTRTRQGGDQELGNGLGRKRKGGCPESEKDWLGW